MRTERGERTALVIAAFLVLIMAYIVVFAGLVGAYRSESALVPKVVAAEKSLAAAQRAQEGNVGALQLELASARERLAAVRARVPTEVQAHDLYERLTQAAQRNSITDFRFQSKGDTPEKLSAGTYRAYRFSIQGRGSYDRLTAFVDSVQQELGATALLDGLSLTPAGNEWQLSADIVVYVLGG